MDRHQQIIFSVQEAVWEMQSSRDLDRVLRALWLGLKALEVPFAYCSLNLLDEAADPPVIRVYSMRAGSPSIRKGVFGFQELPSLVKIWRTQALAYRPDLTLDDPWGERPKFGVPVRALVDTPFPEGTLAISSGRPQAFSDRDLALLRDLAQVMSGSVKRQQDLSSLELEIAARKRAGESFQESENRYRLLLERLPVGVVYTTPDGKILYANPCLSDLLGYTREELSGLEAEALYVRPDDWRDLLRHLHEKGEYSFESPWRRKDGRTVWVRGHTQAIRDREGRIVELQGTTEDITERRKMEEQLIHMERQSAASELAAGVSHNINNMLTGVLLPAESILLMNEVPETVVREAEMIVAAGERVRNLVQRLSDAVRPPQSGSTLGVDLNGEIRLTVELARPRWKDEQEAKGATTRVVTELGAIPRVCGHNGEIAEVILNLLLNAVDAMPEGGTVTVSTTYLRGDDVVSLVVSDSGIGMDEETRRRVFEPFFTTKVDVGSGLGLSTAYGTVARLGGTMEVESDPGRGTTFTIRLPVSREADGAKEPEATPGPPARPGRILLVEDDDAICQTLRRLLSPAHAVDVVRDGGEALQRFTPGQFDLAVIDLGIPTRPGDQVARELRQRDPELVTVLITGWALARDDPRGQAFDLHLLKPIRQAKLVETVIKAMEMHDGRCGRPADGPRQDTERIST